MRRMTALGALGLLLTANGVAAKESASPEDLTAAAMERARATAPQLRLFLQAMPKGGDLHNHPPGSVYAEDILAFAGEQGMCASTETNTLSDGPCGEGEVPVRDLGLTDYYHYSRVIDTISLRGSEKGVGDPMMQGFDRFFFAIDSSGAPRDPVMSLAVTREHASYDNVQYMELMVGGDPGYGAIADAVRESGLDGTDFAALAKVIDPLLPAAIASNSAAYDGFEQAADQRLGCDAPQAPAACDVTMRYQTVAFRLAEPEYVFATLLLGFAMAAEDERFVGVNIVGPEHDPVALRDYDLHMRMFEYLGARYPDVKLSLHAGELTLGLVPPRDLRSHIEQAVGVAGADRIGHGIDIAYEENSKETLRRMAAEGRALEVQLTSNTVILGVTGTDHPLALYREYGVPIVFGTDDEGLTRGDMTDEFMRAVEQQGLTYPELKQAVRNSLEYSFLPGASLWSDDTYSQRAICAGQGSKPDASCHAALDASPKAREQFRLENSLAAFEAEHR